MPGENEPKALLITTVQPDSPDAGPPDPMGRSRILVEFDGEFLGSLAISNENFADFLLACREGFTQVKINRL